MNICSVLYLRMGWFSFSKDKLTVFPNNSGKMHFWFMMRNLLDLEWVLKFVLII